MKQSLENHLQRNIQGSSMNPKKQYELTIKNYLQWKKI